ncbi:MAG: amino acid ABC transporter permease [Chloroflexota bacterium]
MLWVVALLLVGCSSTGRRYTWGWYIVSPLTETGRSNLQFLLRGLWPTISISLLAFFFAILIGLFVGMLALVPGRWPRVINRFYVEVIRAIPLLVLLLWVYYGLPISLGIELDVFTAGVVALALSDSAFEAEIFRSGIQSIAKGQREAAASLGLSAWQSMRLVVLPQAIRRILPPLGNQFVYVLKMSSLVSVIGLAELTRKANELNVTEYRPLEIYTALIVEYLLLILIVSYFVRKLEQRMDVN